VLLLASLAAMLQPWERQTELAVVAPVIERAVPAGSARREKLPVAVPVKPVAAPVELLPEVVVEVVEAEPDERVVPESEQEPEQQPQPQLEPRSLASLLADTDSSNYRAAWTELLALWSVVLPESVKPDFCDFAKQYGLLCMVEQGNWNTLRQFDRPVILQLVAADGRRVPVVLQHLDDSVATVIIGNEVYRLDSRQVENSWYGDYTVLLQVPPGGRLYLRVGDHGPVVSWLRQQLELAQGVSIPAPDPLSFDFPLQQQVLAFQRAHGLVADGIVGKNTMIHLNTASGREGVPRLLMGPS
jgi:general secretion pathway protein A